MFLLDIFSEEGSGGREMNTVIRLIEEFLRMMAWLMGG